MTFLLIGFSPRTIAAFVAFLLCLPSLAGVSAESPAGALLPTAAPLAGAQADSLASAPTSSPSDPSAGTPLEASSSAVSEIVSVTKVVGEVGDRFVTSREVRINQAIQQVLVNEGKSPMALDKTASDKASSLLTGQEKTFPYEVWRVLDEWAVYLEAKSLSSAPPARGDVNKAIRAVQDHWSGQGGWSGLEVSPEELKEIVERKLIAREFERLKGDASLVPVSDAEALSYFQKNRLRFGSLPFSAFKDNIKSFLVKQQTERRLAEWREVLRRKYKIRNFIAG